MARGTTLPPAAPSARATRLMTARHGLAGEARAAHAAVEDALYAVQQTALDWHLGDCDEGVLDIAEGRLAQAERHAARLDAALQALRGQVPPH
jgi:predicted negative regulator of RcsB-dependent stress response